MVRVLIAEPEPDLRLLAEQALLELGHETTLAPADAARGGVDVLLAADSGEALALARALRRRIPALPIVLVGARRPRADLHALGGAVHLLTPYSLAGLERAVAAALSAGEQA